MIDKIRKTFYYSPCYLYWCIFQILCCLCLLSFFFIEIYLGGTKLQLFYIELTVFTFMVIDCIFFFLFLGCRFQPIFLFELFLTLLSGVILCCLLIDDLKKIIEEYDSGLMVTRIIVQCLRMCILGFKTSDGSRKQRVSKIQIKIDNNRKNSDINSYASNISDKEIELYDSKTMPSEQSSNIFMKQKPNESI